MLTSKTPAPISVNSMFNKRYIKHIVIVFFSSALVACAGSPTDPDRMDSRRSDCISQSSIRGYSVLDESNLIVESAVRRKYHVTLDRRAFGLKSTWSIGFRSATNQVCPSFSEIVFDSGIFKESIGIRSIKELTPEEEEILLIRFGKKEPEIKTTPEPADVPGAEVEELDPAAKD